MFIKKLIDKKRMTEVKYVVTFENETQKNCFDKVIDKTKGWKRCKCFDNVLFEGEDERVLCTGVYGKDMASFARFLKGIDRARSKVYRIYW